MPESTRIPLVDSGYRVKDSWNSLTLAAEGCRSKKNLAYRSAGEKVRLNAPKYKKFILRSKVLILGTINLSDILKTIFTFVTAELFAEGFENFR